MQDRYVGDIGDFAKFTLLKALIGSDLKLGVVWYLNAAEETNGDGRFTSYSELREFDPPLHDKLRSIVQGPRKVAALEAGDILPPTTLFYSEPVSGERSSWFKAALEVTEGADVVFLDPDIGIEVPSARGAKYALLSEIKAFADRGQTVVVYQHQQRRPVEQILEHQFCRIDHAQACEACAVSWHARQVRIFRVLPARGMRDRLLVSARQLTSGPLSRYFKVFEKLPMTLTDRKSVV